MFSLIAWLPMPYYSMDGDPSISAHHHEAKVVRGAEAGALPSDACENGGLLTVAIYRAGSLLPPLRHSDSDPVALALSISLARGLSRLSDTYLHILNFSNCQFE